MEKNKKQKSIRVHRHIIQGLFLALSIYLIINFLPSREFMLVALALILTIAIVFRTGFCGWLCPIGTIVDFISRLGEKISGLALFKPVKKRYKKWVKNNIVVLNKIDKYARLFKYVFLLWILQAAFLSIASIKSEDEHGIITVLYLVIGLLVLGLFVDRAWCKYACPLGAIIGIFGKLSPTKVTRDEDLCINCNLCTKSCPMNIDVAKKQYVKSLDCNTCLMCVDACPVEGALDLKINVPFVGKDKSRVTEIIDEQAVE
ncbi:MAG: 4Fe-4S binding protein [Vulcanibacillus sp.]